MGTRTLENGSKPKREGCGRTLTLISGVVFLLFAVIFCTGGFISGGFTGEDFIGEAVMGFSCLGVLSLAAGVLMIRAYRRTGKAPEPETVTAEPILVPSGQWGGVAGELKSLLEESALTEVASELTGFRAKILGLSHQYPRRSMMGGPGAEKVEKQIPWIDRTLGEAAHALITGEDPFGNPITPTQTKNGLVQLISMVSDPEYLTTMDMFYEGIADPLKNGMQELEQIIERIPPEDEVRPQKRTEEPIFVASGEAEELFHAGLELFNQGKYREAVSILEEVTKFKPTLAPVQFTLGGAYSRIACEYGDDEDAVRPWANKSAEAFRKAIDLARQYGGLNEDQLALAQNAVMSLDSAETDYQMQKEASALPEDQRKRIYAEFKETQNSEFLRGTDIQAIEEASRSGDLAQIVQGLERDGIDAGKVAIAKVAAKFQISEELLGAIAQEGEVKKWPWGDT